jgi:uncharacterized protein
VTETAAPRPRRVEPVPTEISAPFWEATREERLVLQWCIDCDQPIFFPRDRCPGCIGSALEWRPATGRGTVYAVTVEQRPEISSVASAEPFAVALVELEEGARMMTNVVGCPPADVTVGMAVTVTWEPLSDGRHLPLFEPAG